MNVKKTALIGLGGLILLAGLIQLIPVQHTNPPVTKEIQWDSPATRQLAQRTCYDCHSNETVWPWYANVAPISWGVVNHVNDGRRHLNFSEWDRRNGRADEIVKAVFEAEMPPLYYTPVHPEANLSSAERNALIEGLKTTLQNDPPLAR